MAWKVSFAAATMLAGGAVFLPGSASAQVTAPTQDETVLDEMRTSEVATDVGPDQIQRLPQTDRNFLSFAALAPGVRFSDSDTDRGITSGASTASQVNLLIDGMSFKNQLRDGGIAGQQGSRGSPFGQIAVQQFRVLTQNYKAEYGEAGAAIVTAVTKSGGNEFRAEAFGQYTGREFAETSYLDKLRNQPEPAFQRRQYGAALGGPIVRDQLFFFAAYEGNDQDRAQNVVAGGTPAQRAAVEASSGRRIGDLEGSFTSPFRSDFYFGKLTFTPDDRQRFDLSFSRREEGDIRTFGGTTAYESAENRRNRVDTLLLNWRYRGGAFANEFGASFLDYRFNPRSLHPDQPQFSYLGVITFGGRDSYRDERQQSYTVRDDLSFTGLAGHVIKLGARVEVTDIAFDNRTFDQPRYSFFQDAGNNLSFAFPAEAQLALAPSRIDSSNTQLGVYVQDDWDVTGRLQFNLGLRWDYETNAFDNDYVTPASAAAALRALPRPYYFDPENYITDGHQRPPFTGAFAPRIGFSYDLSGDGATVIFGAAGRYYDRNAFTNTVDERLRALTSIGTFRFSANGAPRNGQPTVMWNPSYLTRAGLLTLSASAQTGQRELFAVKNDARPPVDDQFSLGIRHRFGAWQASVTGAYIRGRNGYTHLWGTRRSNGLGDCCDNAPIAAFGYSNAIIGYDGLDTRYKALYVTLDKRYTPASGWGLNLVYTLSKGEQNGGDLFSLDGLTPDTYGWRPRAGDERHRIVIAGMVDLPYGFQLATFTQLGSGQAYQVIDATRGFGVDQLRLTSAYPEKNCIGGLFAFCEVNLTVSNRQNLFGRHQVEIALDVLNAFNNKNFSDFDNFYSSTDPLDPARIGANMITQPRRVQFRLGYRF
ncbi:TonB-dependent receptor [Sphingomonas sp. LB-2]|uniref:TonB-dependent receptor plug domain-containing protein n=1 Tax=Sphingomonas caeni TaxID=2984949 RepID=UPI00222E3E4B|nr:TonB-dependent receptor [Sphingomonas caeni]MCW3845712.1 TonB-dependent receptor [Sphingomonas caeni]